jgi:hypothetical protein
MIADEDRRLVERCLDYHFAAFGLRLPAGRVPAAMAVDEPDVEGCVGWRMLPSGVTEADVEDLERGLPGPLPPLFRAYLTARHTLGMDWFDLPDLPPDDALGGVRRALAAWPGLAAAGYVPFTDDAAGGLGPLCFDAARRLPDGDCPVVLFDREDLARQGGRPTRPELEALATTTEPSFRAMLLANFPEKMNEPEEPDEPEADAGDEGPASEPEA